MPIDRSLIVHFNGSTFVDSSVYGHTLTPTGTPTMVADAADMGGAAGYYNGGSQHKADVHTSLAFGSGDFTIHFRIRSVAGQPSPPRILGNLVGGYGTNGWTLGFEGNTLKFYSANLGTPMMTSAALVDGTRYHVAIVRFGNVWTTYINGVASATTTVAGALDSGAANHPFFIAGSGLSEYWKGYLDELVVVKEAVWTANFTPPTAEEPNPAVTITGTISSGQAGQTVAIAGSIMGTSGSVSSGQAGQASSISGGTRLSAAIDVGQSGQATQIAAKVVNYAVLSGGQGGQTSLLAGLIFIPASISSAQGGQTSFGSGAIRNIGAIAAGQGGQTGQFVAGLLVPVVGSMNSGQGGQTSSSTLVRVVYGTIQAAQGSQTVLATMLLSHFSSISGAYEKNASIQPRRSLSSKQEERSRVSVMPRKNGVSRIGQ